MAGEPVVDWQSELDRTVAPQPVRTVPAGVNWDASLAAGSATIPPPRPQDMNVQSESQYGAEYGDVAAASFADSTAEAIHYYARQMYPDEPVEQAIKRFGTQGNEIYHVPDLSRPTEAFLVAPGFIKGSLTGTGKLLPVGAGVATGIATLPLTATGVGLLGSMALTAGAAGLAETGRQKLGDWMMDSPEQFTDVNTGQVGRESLYGGAGQVPGTGLIAYGTRNAARDIGQMESTKTAQAYEQAAVDRIPITVAEATGVPSMLATQKRLSQRTTSMDKAAAFYENRQSAISTAWDNMLGKLHPSGDLDAIGQQVKDTATKIISGVTEKRSAAASESYGKVVHAGNEAPGLSLDPYVAGVIKELRDDPLTGRILEGLPDNNIVVIDAVGKELRTRANAAAKGGDNFRSGMLTDLRAKLIGEGSLVDRLFPAYREARTEFAGLSREVEEMSGSIISAISKVKDTELVKIGMEALDPAKRTPATVAKARQLISAENPEAWAGIVKAMMHTGSRSASKETATGMSLGGKLYYKFFGDKFMKNNLRAAMPENHWVNFKNFMTTLQRTAKVKPMGSDTAQNQVINAEKQEEAALWVSKLVKTAVSPHKWGQMADDWVTARRLTNADEKMAELIFDRASDPSVIHSIKELRKLTPGSERSRMLFGHLMTRLVEQGEQEITAPPSVAPPIE